MFGYWYVLNDYGIPLRTTIFVLNKKGFMPNAEDVYQPDLESRGNSNFGNEEFTGTLLWEK